MRGFMDILLILVVRGSDLLISNSPLYLFKLDSKRSSHAYLLARCVSYVNLKDLIPKRPHSGLENPGESAYNENSKALNQSRRERERYGNGKKAGDFFGLHMTLVLFQYRAY